MNIDTILEFLAKLGGLGKGWRTYIAAAGLLGLAAHQLSVGEYQAAAQSFFGALAAAGLRNAVTRASVAASGRAV